MTEYIERGSILNHVKVMHNAVDTSKMNKDFDDGFHSATSQVMGMIVWLPAADVAPVQHGGWLLRHEGYGHYLECSVCHTNPCIYVKKDTKFCPNCGAKMDAEEFNVESD